VEARVAKSWPAGRRETEMNSNNCNGYDALLNALRGETDTVPYDEVDWPALLTRIMQRAEIWFDAHTAAVPRSTPSKTSKSELTTSRR
jgi:hypothetical protein